MVCEQRLRSDEEKDRRHDYMEEKQYKESESVKNLLYRIQLRDREYADSITVNVRAVNTKNKSVPLDTRDKTP